MTGRNIMDADQAVASRELVRRILMDNLAPLVGLASRQPLNRNAFLEAISPTLAVASKLTRSLTSQLGGRFASIARALATARYGQEAVPALLVSPSLSADPRIVTGRTGDTVILTQLPEAATRQAATALLRQAGSAPAERIGTEVFRRVFAGQVQALLDLPRNPAPWSCRVDLFVANPAIGLAELESGGELDSSNVKGQPEKLVLAGLALADPAIPLHFCLAYANAGEGNPIRGGLPQYLAPAGSVTPSSGLWVGRRWWEQVLPTDIPFDVFLGLFAEVARELQIVPGS